MPHNITALSYAELGTRAAVIGATSDSYNEHPVIAYAARRHVEQSGAEERLIGSDVVAVVMLGDGRLVPARSVPGFVLLLQPGESSLLRPEIDAELARRDEQTS